jgi:hypothetical protein
MIIINGDLFIVLIRFIREMHVAVIKKKQTNKTQKIRDIYVELHNSNQIKTRDSNKNINVTEKST